MNRLSALFTLLSILGLIGPAPDASATDLDLVMSGVGVPSAGFFTMLKEPGAHQIEFELHGHLESNTPCTTTNEGFWSARIVLSDNQPARYPELLYILPFANVSVEVSVVPLYGSGVPETVLVAEGGSATITWHSELGGYFLEAVSTVTQRRTIGPTCWWYIFKDAAVSSLSFSAGLDVFSPGDSDPVFTFNGHLRDAVRVVPVAQSTWGALKERYR